MAKTKKSPTPAVVPTNGVPPVTSGESIKNDRIKNDETEIRVLAYQKWIAAGMPPGDGTDFWIEAEREIRQGSGKQPSSAPIMPAPKQLKSPISNRIN